MSHEETYIALAAVLSNLGKQFNPLEDDSFTSRIAANGIKQNHFTLPGPDSSAKRTLEKEVAALAGRIQFLESKATGSNATLPITPNEPLSSVFVPDSSPTSANRNGTTLPLRKRSASWVNSILARRGDADEEENPREFSVEELTRLREHVDKQTEQIQVQKEYINNINVQLSQQQQATKQALGGIENSMDDVETLKRELSKNQQINSTYQKVLRDIGRIITAVANGDLSKKVLISAQERDPEIATFKRTINKMVDQLQEFASQVTHLAKEVGTEGRLGGQAVLPGVDGIWAELTQNGTLRFPPRTNFLLTDSI